MAHEQKKAMKMQKKNGSMQATFDAKIDGQGQGIIKKINPMHKTTVDASGKNGSQFPKLPGINLKADGETRMPISDRDKTLKKFSTNAYALSPKMVNRLRRGAPSFEEKMMASKADSPPRLQGADLIKYRVELEREIEANTERAKKQEANRELNEIRKKYEQFQHMAVNGEAMKAFDQYMKDKMTSR